MQLRAELRGLDLESARQAQDSQDVRRDGRPIGREGLAARRRQRSPQGNAQRSNAADAQRDSYVSLMDDAGFSLERIGDYVGHSSAYMTDGYRHLIEGHEAEAAERFEDYLTRAVGST
jgi:hypothetical protein